MEGLAEIPRPASARPGRIAWGGYLTAGLIAGAAWGIHFLPFAPFRVTSGGSVRHPVSPAIIAIVVGVLVRNLLTLPEWALGGAKRVARTVIPATIVLTGAGLDLGRMAGVGLTALIVTLACIVIASLTAVWFGRVLEVWPKTALLVGAGTAICGTSAIIATAPVIEATEEDLLLSIGAVNLLGLVLMFALPAAGHLLQMKDDAFGVWAGTSIHAVPQVVAAGFAFSASAGALATLVKLVRVALLVPFLFVLGMSYAHGRKTQAVRYSRLVPRFIWGFMILALLNTLGLLPVLQFRFGSAAMAGVLTYAGEILLALSMAAMGLEVSLRMFVRVGGRAVLTGAAATITLCVASWILIRILL